MGVKLDVGEKRRKGEKCNNLLIFFLPQPVSLFSPSLSHLPLPFLSSLLIASFARRVTGRQLFARWKLAGNLEKPATRHHGHRRGPGGRTKHASTSDSRHRARLSRTADPFGVNESGRLLSPFAMTTRAGRLGKEEVPEGPEGPVGLRRSPRNLPQHLKEKLEQPKPEREPDVKTLPPIVFKGRIQFADDFFDCAQICDDLLQEVRRSEKEIIPIGFDLEWPFNFQTGSGKTALVQICLENNACYLLYIYSLKKLPAAFVELLHHPKVKLVGVNVKNDVWKLGRDFKEFPAQKVVENNCLDCGTYANQVLKRSCRWSLEKLTAYLLKKKINKDPEVRMSRWHMQPLSDVQKSYAATDAYVSLLLYTTIQEKAVAIEKENQNDENSLNPSI